jgi:hypothetical protein
MLVMMSMFCHVTLEPITVGREGKILRSQSDDFVWMPSFLVVCEIGLEYEGLVRYLVVKKVSCLQIHTLFIYRTKYI